ncbi:MAG: hypothetical protein RLZZ181_106 [Pseudomonadota bacterium]|jgi:hypothetical protein
MSAYSDLAHEIFTVEFGSDTSVTTFSQISGWFSTNLGLLNNLLYSNFTGADPNLGIEEKAIFKELYLSNFYTKQARNALRGILSSSNNGDNILSVSDGDNSITFVNRNEVSKVYRGLATDSQAKLKDLIASYNSYKAEPRQLGGIEAGYFSGSGVYYGVFPYSYYPGGYL